MARHPARNRTEDDSARSATSATAENTECTEISNDGPRQPSTDVDAPDGSPLEPAQPEPAERPSEPDPNGAETTASSTPEPPAPADSPDEAEDGATGEVADGSTGGATTPEPPTMTTTDTDGSSAEPKEQPEPTGDRDAGDSSNGATPATDAGTSTDAEATTDAAATTEAATDTTSPAPKASHDPVTDAVTREMPAVPASVPGLDDKPAGSGAGASDPTTGAAPAASEPNGSTSTSSPTAPAESAPSAGDAAPAGPAAPPQGLAVTTEMPRIDAPAPAPDPAASPADSRPVYEVRAAGVKAEPTPPATTPSPPLGPPAPAESPASETPAAEPPVTEQIPSVAERPSPVRDTSARDEPTRIVLGGEERPRHFRVSPAKPINTGEVPQVDDEPKRRRRSRGATLAIVAPLVVVMLLIVAWAADTASLSGQVLRNVEIAGRQIGGKGEAALPEIMADVAAEQAERPVTIEIEGREPYEANAAALGLVLDEDATIEEALDTGRGDTVFVRPIKWLRSFFSPREVPLQFAVTETQTAATLQLLQGDDHTAPTDPSIQLTDAGFVMTPGRAGEGVDIEKVASDLLAEAEATPDGPITIRAEVAPVRPQFTDEQAQQLADRANGLTANGITLKADTLSASVSPQQLRSWIQPTVVDGGLDLAFNTEKATAELPGLFGDVDAEPKDASMTLEGGTPKVVPAVNGLTCCGDNAADLVWQAVRQEQGEVALEAVVTEPEITTAEVESWGIKEPVGGSRGYQSGAEVNGGVAPGFTTFHACCEPRVTNIHRIADLVRGTVIPPDGTFSVNETVGQRTAAKGFVEAGAIAEGKHVQEIGGGVSQFATTTFNAAYFAGLDIEESQSHSEWFSRYPPGREATMGYPNPDLVIHNNTPYGVMIWTSYTDTSLTVTMYSTRWATAEQSGISEGRSGNCRVVTTTRTRSYPDGSSEQDTFRSTYRPGEGKTC